MALKPDYKPDYSPVSLRLSRITGDEIRSLLATDFAMAAFNRMDALGPKWSYREGGGRVCVSSTIQTKTTGARFPDKNEGIWGASLDEAITKKWAQLTRQASLPRKIVVVNSFDPPNYREFVYRNETIAFEEITRRL